MSTFSTDSSTHYQFNPPHVPPPSPAHLDMFASNSSSESGSEHSQDSVSKSRRHGMYFHRPPVWYPHPCPHNSPLTLAKARSISCGRWKGSLFDASNCSYEAYHERELYLSCPKCSRHVKLYTDRMGYEESDPWATGLFCETTAAAIGARVDAEHSDSNSENSKYSRTKEQSTTSETSMNPSYWQSSMKENLSDVPLHCLRQTKPGLCTRLQLCKDVRVGVGERWAIQEGSLVVCIDPFHTLLDRREGFPDEFELASGDFYIVCRLYADLWALCIKASFDTGSGKDSPTAGDSMSLGFLPLCAVTLAANFGAFVQRCLKHMSYSSSEAKHPGNGLVVIPPERSHSINASKQIFQGDRHRFQLPATLRGACSNLAIEDATVDFIPLDSTLGQLFSKFGGRKERAHQLRSRMSLHNLWHVKSPAQQRGDSLVLSPGKVLHAALQIRGGNMLRFEDPRILNQNSSPAREARRRAPSTPARKRTMRCKREIRSLIHSGSEKLRSGFWTSSDL